MHDIEDLIARMHALLVRGDYTGAATLFVVPCPFYCGTDMQVMTDRSQVAAMMRDCCETAARMGATGMRFAIRQISAPRRNGSLVRVEWIHTGSQDQTVAVTPVRYLCGPDGDSLAFHLAEIDGTAPVVWTAAALEADQFHS